MAFNRPAGMSDEDSDDEDGYYFDTPKKRIFLPQAQTKNVEKTLQDAIINGKLEDVDGILCNDLNNRVNGKLQSGWTPLMHACFHTQKEIVKFFLDKGADPNLHADSITPIMLVCSNKTADDDTILDLILMLIEKDCLLNIGDKYGETPLMRAISCGRVAVVQKLLDMHVNKESRDANGWTPLFWAVHHNQPEILELLISQGARMTEVDQSGHTPLDIARTQDHTIIFDKLRNHLNIDKKRNEPKEPPEHQTTTWFDYYPGVTNPGLPSYYSEIPHLLYGMSCEQIEPLIRNKGIDLRTFLLLQDDDMIDLGIEMQFLRRRLQHGLQTFHRRSWKLNAVAGLFTAKKDFSVLDCLTTLGSHLQQVYILEATLQYSLRDHRRTHKYLKPEPPDSPVATKTEEALKVLLDNIGCIRGQIKIMRKALLKISSKNPCPADLIKETAATKTGIRYLTETVMCFSVGLLVYNFVTHFISKK